MSDARERKRLSAFYEATSKPRTGIHRHCHHWHPNTSSDTCAQPTEDAVPNRIRKVLPPNMHLPIPSSDPLHFYRYLWSHMLVEERQFLLLIDVPIQDRAQQIQIYKIINLPVPVGNYSMRYTINNKYLGVTYDRTKVMDIPEDQFKLCKEANEQFYPLTTPLQPLMNPSSCVAALYMSCVTKMASFSCELT